MKHFDQCVYPPSLASDVEISTQGVGGSPLFVAGSASAGRYLKLGATERQVLELLDGRRSPAEVCGELLRRNGRALSPASFTRLLSKLDEVGILAGERPNRSRQALWAEDALYPRWSLFNPDLLFTDLLPALRWIWTPWFVAASIVAMLLAVILALMNWDDVYRYGTVALREHYLSVFLAAWLVTVSHEFAHGMTLKAFGGRATEVGALLIYYCFPALYCNVSGIHMIPQRGRRMWVIGAGVYWQLLVGAFAMLTWFLFQPLTGFATVAMAFALGSLLELAFNGNPLIKLDGYYFLSQWLGIPNLMQHSRTRWRALLGGRDPDARRFSSRENLILLIFGFCSYVYKIVLLMAISWYGAMFLMNRLGFAGLLLSVAVGVAALWRPIHLFARERAAKTMPESGEPRSRLFVPGAICTCLLAALCTPWTASVGSPGVLVTIPGREIVVRAPESGFLTALFVQPGQAVSNGTTLGRMGNPDVEEQIAQVRTELARVNGDGQLLTGEIGVQRAAAITSEWLLAQRRQELNDVEKEEQQIVARQQAGSGTGFVLASNVAPAGRLPAALAVLEANVEELRAKLAEADREKVRARSLFEEDLLAGAKLDAAEANASAIAFDLVAARERLNAALIEHRRRRAAVETDVNVASSQIAAGRAQAANLGLQLDAARRLRASLEARLALLERKRAQFALAAFADGTIVGDNLPRMSGEYFARGAEICRIADMREFFVRVQVAEQSFGDIAVGQEVRVKTRVFPDRVFHGNVSTIGGESELDSNGQKSYRVELKIQNPDGLLKPGMSAFARISFGRHTVAWLIGHKLRQALRPELWML